MNKRKISLILSCILIILIIFAFCSKKDSHGDEISTLGFSIYLLPLVVIIVKNVLFIIKGEDNYYDLNRFYKLNIYFSTLNILMFIAGLLFSYTYGYIWDTKPFNTYVINSFSNLFLIMAAISVLLNIYLIVLKKRKIKVKENKNIEKTSN